MPVHYINISRDYADDIEAQAVKTGLQPFRTDLNVMLTSGTNIQGQMEQVDTDLGYTWDSYTDPNSVRIGVNWGYTSSQLESKLDPELVIAIAAFLLLVIFTGYLIIYNIFQISVAGDIRFYGLLKTIGTTPRQLKRIIRQQALLLCLIGIPAGLLLGYGIGAVLVPVVLHSIQLDTGITTISTSPVIFLGSMLFALLTVLLSCSKPGKMAAKVSPVEATKYTDVMQTKKKRRSIRGAKLHQMAFANLGRNKKKTVLVVVSLALSVTLFNALCAFVGGFSMEKYVSFMTCALVELPYSMSYRYGGAGYDAVLSVDTAQRDSGGAVVPMLYLFDTADEADEAEAEQYLSKLTAGEFSPLMYESKATVRSEFAQFRQMFLLIGGILCAIIGLVGLLNFFNAMMTGILSRRREFAVLQAVGMTPRQLKTMLIYEGLFYAMSSVAAAFILSLAVGPLAGKMLGSMFWFFEYRFTILPVLLTIPVFLLLGWLIPCMMYDNAAKCSVVEQLRDAQ